MARPKLNIDPVKVKRLASMGLTIPELAAVFECDVRTIERRFAGVIKDGRTRLNASLKRKQVSVALKGNVAMLIWLGKQYLGQTDKLMTEVSQVTPAKELAEKLKDSVDRHNRQRGVGPGSSPRTEGMPD